MTDKKPKYTAIKYQGDFAVRKITKEDWAKWSEQHTKSEKLTTQAELAGELIRELGELVRISNK